MVLAASLLGFGVVLGRWRAFSHLRVVLAAGFAAEVALASSRSLSSCVSPWAHVVTRRGWYRFFWGCVLGAAGCLAEVWCLRRLVVAVLVFASFWEGLGVWVFGC